MSEKKIELEKRIHSIQSDRDGLSTALDEATDRIMMLERQTREQEIQVSTMTTSCSLNLSGRKLKFASLLYPSRLCNLQFFFLHL